MTQARILPDERLAPVGPVSLEDRVAVVTGSSSGIGAAIARRFAAEGARVIVNSSSSRAAGELLAAELTHGLYVQGDIADRDAATNLVEAALQHWGRLDVLVNNAGTTAEIPHDDLDAVTPEIWQRILGVNLVGTWNVIRAATAALRASGDGCIINVTSMSGTTASGSSIPYAVSKAAVNHLTVLLANVLGPDIRVNAVAPGLIDTPWTSDWEDVHAAVAASAPLRRVGLPADVSEVCSFLARAAYTTGAVIPTDGGVGLRFGAS